jgi:gluconate 2-dehydrogenase gamma chain
MSENNVSRRDLFLVAGAAASVAPLAAQQSEHAQHEHGEEKKEPGGAYTPQVFNPRDYKTLQALTALTIPADATTGSAVEAGAPEFIDRLAAGNSQIRDTFLGGLAWLDHAMNQRTGKTFVEASPAEQTALLDLIAYRKNDSPDLGPGIRFFDWARRLTVDAFYTSVIGIKDVGYRGNVGMTKFEVPREAIDYVLKRSPLA